MDDKELGRMLRLEKVEENTFSEEKTKEVLEKEKHDQLKFRLKKESVRKYLHGCRKKYRIS